MNDWLSDMEIISGIEKISTSTQIFENLCKKYPEKNFSRIWIHCQLRMLAKFGLVKISYRKKDGTVFWEIGERKNELSQPEFENEKWLPVTGYEGLYEVSDCGRVRGLDKNRGKIGRIRGKILKQGTFQKGHKHVKLCKDGHQKTTSVHRIVLSAFIGPCPDGMECCHNDGNPANNHINNLRWDTRSNNQYDALLHGTKQKGEEVYSSKLNEDAVRDIRENYKKFLAPHFSKKYGVSQNVIYRVKNFKGWKHVK